MTQSGRKEFRFRDITDVIDSHPLGYKRRILGGYGTGKPGIYHDREDAQPRELCLEAMNHEHAIFATAEHNQDIVAPFTPSLSSRYYLVEVSLGAFGSLW
ncbi:hypothetical protein [Streptomyces sp. NPDC048419]|uniref:hypothetical protein n=1 Tax=Streptomyces sp. NPDC048419 TaxID=3365547 RepID=UPI00371B8219